MLFKVIIALHSENHMKPTTTLCGQNEVFLSVKGSKTHNNYCKVMCISLKQLMSTPERVRLHWKLFMRCRMSNGNFKGQIQTAINVRQTVGVRRIITNNSPRFRRFYITTYQIPTLKITNYTLSDNINSLTFPKLNVDWKVQNEFQIKKCYLTI
jgi:hypothetical protein